MKLSIYQNKDSIKIYTDIKEYDIVSNDCMLIYDKLNRTKGVIGVYNIAEIIKYAKHLTLMKNISALTSLFQYIERQEA